MANRPAQLRYLQKDKAIGAHKGFAESWNWLLSSFNNLRCGKGLKLSWKAVDRPVIELDENDDEEGAGGAVTVTGTDGTSASGSDITFASAEDANVEVSVAAGSSGGVVVTVGAYYT